MKQRTYHRIRKVLQVIVFSLPILPFMDITSWHSGIFYDDGIPETAVSPWWFMFAVIIMPALLINWAAMARNHAQESSGRIAYAYVSCVSSLMILALLFAFSYSFRLFTADVWAQISNQPEAPDIDPFARANFWWAAWFLFVGYGMKAYWDEAVKSFAEWHQQHILSRPRKSSANLMREIRENSMSSAVEYIDWSYDDENQPIVIISVEILRGQKDIALDHLSQIFGNTSINLYKKGPAGGALLYQDIQIDTTIAEIFDTLCDIQDKDNCELVVSAQIPTNGGELILFDTRDGKAPDPEKLAQRNFHEQ